MKAKPARQARKRLLVPFRASTGENFQPIKGTQFFAERNSLGKRKVIERFREWKPEAFDLASKCGPELFRSKKYLKELRFWQRHGLAEKSEFYIKPLTKRQRLIRQLLLKAGIPIEAPMEVRNLDASDIKRGVGKTDLGKGMELFERKGFERIPGFSSVLNLAPLKNPEKIKEQIRGIVSKMHFVGVSHNHLHGGNFVMQDGKLKLIDLAKARLCLAPPRNRREFLSRFSDDLYLAAKTLAEIEIKSKNIRFPSMDLFPDTLRKELDLLLDSHSKLMNTFGVRHAQVSEFLNFKVASRSF